MSMTRKSYMTKFYRIGNKDGFRIALIKNDKIFYGLKRIKLIVNL